MPGGGGCSGDSGEGRFGKTLPPPRSTAAPKLARELYIAHRTLDNPGEEADNKLWGQLWDGQHLRQEVRDSYLRAARMILEDHSHNFRHLR
jgi:hypothetical protein